MVSAALTSPVTIDTTAPQVASTDPVDTEPAAPRNGSVTINWDENIDCSTVNTTNITSTSPGWSFNSCSGSQAIFNASLQTYATLYSVTVTSNVRDVAGNPMAASYGFSYTTENQPCIYGVPSISIAETNQDVTTDNGFVDYTVTVNNTDTGSCGDTTFTLLATENPATADFTESFPGGNTILLSPGANGNLTVRSTATNGALNGVTQTLDIKTDGSGDVNHSDSNQLSRTTGLNVPCNVAPTASFLTTDQSITTEGGSAAYTIQVQNDNALACGNTDFDLVVVDGGADVASFVTPSVFTTDPLTVAPGGGTNTTTLTMTAAAGAANGKILETYFYTALNGTIPKSANSGLVQTDINRPCSRNPASLSHAVNQNISLDGTAVYTLTVTNNDVDCADETFTFGITSETESAVGSFNLPSVFSTPNVIVPAGGSSAVATYTVTASGTGSDNDFVTSDIFASSSNHANATTSVVTTLKAFNPLIHNSFSTGSTKHSGAGGWGVAGGRYGEFTCGTCHKRGSTNIKRIKETISFPDSSIMPSGSTSTSVTFLDALEPTDDFGNDSDIPRTANRICEVCHTYDATQAAGTNKHAYDQPVNSNHENGKDCTSCHKHNAGFSAAGGSCDSCHGYPPDPADAYSYQAAEGKGAHVKHVNHLAALAGITLDPNNDSFGDANVSVVCGVCHDMNATTHEMGGGAGANRNINFNGSATFQFGTAAPAYNGVEDVSSSITPKTCSNINCHFQQTPWWE